MPALEDVGVDCRVCCLKTIAGNPLEARLRRGGIEVDNLGSHGLRDLGAFVALRRLIREHEVDLVHAHLTDACIWGAAACRLQSLPLVATVHSPPAVIRRPEGLRSTVRERLLRAGLARQACRTLAVSAWLRDRIVAAWPEVSSRLEVVHNGVDAPAPGADACGPTAPAAGARFRAGLEIPEDVPLASAVAVLRQGKGLDTLLAAIPQVLERVPAARFAIVGGGPLRAELEARAEELGMREACRFAGFHDELGPVYAATDVLVLPSVDDPLPTVLLEAMAAAVPVVGCRSGGVPEIVDDGVTGILVEPGDTDRLGRAITRLLASPAERERMGAAARQRHRSRFSAGGWARRLREVYEDCTGGRP